MFLNASLVFFLSFARERENDFGFIFRDEPSKAGNFCPAARRGRVYEKKLFIPRSQSAITIESGKDFPGFLISHHHQQGNTAHERALEWRSTAESGVLL